MSGQWDYHLFDKKLWCPIDPAGHIVTVTNPITGKKVTATTIWISPSKGTLKVRYADGTTGYTYPKEV